MSPKITQGLFLFIAKFLLKKWNPYIRGLLQLSLITGVFTILYFKKTKYHFENTKLINLIQCLF